MYHIYLDPFLFACPAPSEGQLAFESFLNGIIFLNELKDSPWASLFITEKTIDTLYKVSRFPIGPDLNLAVSAFGSDTIPIKDVIGVIQSLWQRLPSIESHSLIEDLLIDSFSTLPQMDEKFRPKPLADVASHIVTTAALVEDQKLYNERQVVLSRDFKSKQGKIALSCQILDITGATKITTPHSLSKEVWLCDNAEDFHYCLEPLELWLSSPNGIGQHQAIVSLVELAGGSKKKWQFGKEFLSTASKNGFLHMGTRAKSLLRACVETITETNMPATHKLRESKGATAPQIIIGSNRAFRRDVDYEYHLHYWETPQGIEFAAIVVHNTFSIPACAFSA